MSSYTITAGNDNPFGPSYSNSANTPKQAAKLAREMCQAHPELPVYVEFYRSSDSQHGYLNPSGDHDIAGRNWNN